MSSYAVIQTGGKQYLVHPEDVINVELLPGGEGTAIEIKPLLAAGEGDQLKVGRPYIENGAVNAIILKHIRDTKVISFKQKRRKGYRRKKGHRQALTILKIKEIVLK